MTLRYIGPAYVCRECVPDSLPDNHISSVWYTDLNVNYDFTDMVSGYVGAHNLFDVQPPETYIGSGLEDTGTGTISTIYDPLGLFVYTGVTLKM